jgi:dTDP-4-dehydrorhamnose reductase
MILVTGASGMVGSYLTDVFLASEMHRTDLQPRNDVERLDIRNADAVNGMFRRIRPTSVLHLAAETDVDRCEREIDHAYTVNTIGTYNVALACLENNVDMIYVSTTAVFDGSKPEPYNEFDIPFPLTVYSKTKYEGENIVKSICPRWYIVRAGWMYGGGLLDKKFVGKVVAQCLAGKTELRAVNDKFGSPTYAHDLVMNIKILLEQRKYGLYHSVDRGGCCSRYDIAVEIAKHFGLVSAVTPVSSDEFNLSANRSKSEAAVSYKLDLLGLNQMRPWREALQEYLASNWLPKLAMEKALATSVGQEGSHVQRNAIAS